MAFKVLIPEDIAEKGKNFLIENGYEIKMGRANSEDLICEDVADCDALLVRNTRYTRRVMEAGKKLKVIARHGTGVDNIDLKAAEELGIWVVNGPVANIEAVAEYTMALLLALSCGILKVDRYTKANDWSYRLFQKRTELTGKVLGIVGFGRVGRSVARRAVAGLGMEVTAYDKYAKKDSLFKGVALAEDLGELLRSSDYVSLHTPSTPETRGMICKKTLEQMKPTASLINCSRGDICVEPDLVDALKNGTIASAALDVYEEEPMPAGHPLLKMDNVILSQHCAGLSLEALDNMAYYAAVGIHEVLSGKEPTWPVVRPKTRR